LFVAVRRRWVVAVRRRWVVAVRLAVRRGRCREAWVERWLGEAGKARRSEGLAWVWLGLACGLLLGEAGKARRSDGLGLGRSW